MIRLLRFFICLILFTLCSTLELYGVRWFLGNHFTNPHSPKNINNNYYILCFNSEGKFAEDVYIEIASSTFTCSHRQI